MMNMLTRLSILFLLALVLHGRLIRPTMLLPVETTMDVKTEYSFGFYTDVSVPHSASIEIKFPYQFDPRGLISNSGCKIKHQGVQLEDVDCSLNYRTFTIPLKQPLSQGTITVTIGGILNPLNYQMSSNFVIKILYQSVTVAANPEFGKTPFTSPPHDSGSTLSVFNYENHLIEQGSSWVFSFTPSKKYPVNSTIRFMFPDGFYSNKVQCNISGISDRAMKSRVFPNKHVYDCLNINGELEGQQKIILSGLVNPDYKMTVNSIKLHILQPNNKVSVEKFEMQNSVEIKEKDMNVTMNIPNKYRNNTITYIYELNMDSNLYYGDYLKIEIDGSWTFFPEDCQIIEGVNGDDQHVPAFKSVLDWPTKSYLYLTNFSSILKSSQIAFYVSLKTPLTKNIYPMVISAFRSHGGLVETYSQDLQINQTTGYIRQMRLHPMVQTIKLPVGQTGPLQITLGLRYNLPKTNVLTYGKFIIKITPNLPKPDVSINGVPKCYFYGNIEAKNCTYDDSNAAYTLITVFTPTDFNFQSSQVPFMVTTEGYTEPQYEGITIDSLVKRYHFHIQFYTDYQEEPVPTEVIFGDWVPDSIPFTTFACETTSKAERSYDHLKCTFTTPSEDLNEPGFVHIFRLQFTGSSTSDPPQYGWNKQLGYNANEIFNDYPCLGYGTNLVADPYIKCDLVTWTQGPYASVLKRPHINIYGFEKLPKGSLVTIEIPKIQRYTESYDTQIAFSILQDTYGYQTDYITLYSQKINTTPTTNLDTDNDDYEQKTLTYTLSNQIINKVTDISFPSLNLTVAGITHIIFEVDQGTFQDIGRAHGLTCGDHTCSKFNKPIQYFILYPSAALNQIETLTFPDIVTPDHAGEYEFRLRLYKSSEFVANWKFNVEILPQTLDAPLYEYHSTLESQTVLYPNTLHYYSISWTTKNPLPQKTAYIEIILKNHFKLASDYCVLTTTATAADDRGIQCQIQVNSDTILIQHMAQVPAATAFKIDLQLISTDTAGTISPQVSIYTYYDTDVLVDQVENAAFSGTTITNQNLKTFTEFEVKNPASIPRKIRKGYFGHLLLNIRPRTNDAASDAHYLVLTFTPQFYPYSNALNLPMICEVKNERLPCTYTLNPFVVTISEITNKLSVGNNNQVNITTQYLDHDGIHHPADQGRYLIKAQIYRSSYSSTVEYVEQYIDIEPNPIQYFNSSYAHLDTNRDNIFTFWFRNGPEQIPAYDDSSSAGRIYIGFPTADDNNNNVFSDNLGYSTGSGTAIPCWFKSAVGYIEPLTGKELGCRLIASPQSPIYTYVGIINFKTLPANTDFKVIMAKILNPSTKQYDINFKLKVNLMKNTRQETPLYESDYNMFFDMMTASVSSLNQADTTSTMFEPGSKIGDTDKYFVTIPYSASGFSEKDWFIVDMDKDFELEGTVGDCFPSYYEHCIVFKEVNWLAIRIKSTNLINVMPRIVKLPTSLSRVLTNFQAFTFKSERWAETITYTITPQRWLQLQGTITGFNFEVLGSHDKLNINQKNVDVLVTFTVTHVVNRGGCIEIQFPNKPTFVPSIKPHCRSAVTLGSALYGDPTGKPSTNIQGDVGCLVQNDYSWIITSFDELPAGSQVKIYGQIDFPTVEVTSLGLGYVVTYSDAVSNTFTNGRMIDYGSFNFPLSVSNLTWKLDPNPTMHRSQPLRVNHKGELKFKINLASQLSQLSSGYIDIATWKYNTMGAGGGFSGPTSKLVCKILRLDNNERYGCQVTSASSQTNYYYYRIQSFENLPSGNDYQITLTTQNGDSNQGLNFPSSTGVYKIEASVKYYSSSNQQVSQPHFIEVYGPDFTVLNFISTVDIPGEDNMILVEFKPPNTIATNEQFIIEIPTVGIDGVNMIQNDLGVGYEDYDDLVFDLYESDVTSMQCKVYTGDNTNHQPVKIICSNFNIAITNSKTVKMGFWIKNPTVSFGLAIPVQVYSYSTRYARKQCWSLVEAGIKILPTSVSPISDDGNFATSSSYRQISSQDFSFTTRNTQPLKQHDLYIMKFNFDLRNQQKQSQKFKYNSAFAHNGDVIFMRNCATVLLRVGASQLAVVAAGGTTVNAKIESVFYNPKIQLTSTQKAITAFAVYLETRSCEKILHKDTFPDLVPREFSNPSVSFTSINGNTNKGEREDYKIQFSISDSTDSDMALVKRISIQFPPFATYDMKFYGEECIEDISSQIEIQDCYIDTTTYTMWLTPAQKTSFTNNNNFIIETKGLSIINPQNSASIDLNKFVVRYYTWEGEQNPALFPNSEDYVFMKADDSQISSSTVSFTGTFYAKHDYLDIPKQNYVNDLLPASTYLGTDKMKTPLQFVFKAMAAFSSLDSSSSNYHRISVTFNSYYSHQSINSRSQDLYYYIPTCELNGKRIHQCTISSGKIQMKFHQAIASGEEVAVRFSVLNPKDLADDGFKLNSLSHSMVTLPIQFRPYGQSSYYTEAEPFNTYYKVSSTYPQFGIFEATVTPGTVVYNKFNYLTFQIKFSRNDINGLVLQIPVINQDGTVIYSTPELLGLESGSDYPCSVGLDTDVYCYYEQGSSSGFGRSTRIYITDFTLPANKILSLRILFTNPDQIGSFPNFIFKAYGGTYTQPSLMGNVFMGSYQIIEPFKILADTDNYQTDTCTIKATKGLWVKQTQYRFYVTKTQSKDSYVVLEWILNHATYGEVSKYTRDSSATLDQFIINYSKDDRRLYIVKQLSADYTGTGYYSFGYLRNKHFKHNSFKMHMLKRPKYGLITCSVDYNHLKTNYMVDQYGKPDIQYLDIQDRTKAQDTWQYISIDMKNAQNIAFEADDPAEMIVAVQFNTNKPFDYFVSTYQCNIEAGVTSNDPLKPVTCQVQNNDRYQFLIKNVNKFTGQYLRIYSKVRSKSSDTQNIQVQVRMYANSQSFENSNGWALFITQSTSYSGLYKIYYIDNKSWGNLYYNRPDPADHDYSQQMIDSNRVFLNGFAKVQSISSTQVRVRLKPGQNFSGYNVYYMVFRMYMSRYSFNGCTSPSISGPDSYPSGRSSDSTGGHAWMTFSYHNGHVVSWPYWSSNQEIILTWNCNSITGQINGNPDNIYVSVSVNYFKAHYGYYYKKNSNGHTYRQYGVYQSSYGTFMIHSRGSSAATKSPTKNLASSTSIDLLSGQRGRQTQLSISVNDLKYSIGSDDSYLLFHIHHGTGVFSNNNPFPFTSNSEIGAYIDCKCVVSSSSISITSTTNYQEPKCVRYLPLGMQASIGVFLTAATGNYVRCFFPGFLVPNSGSKLNIDAFKKTYHYLHRYIPRQYYSVYGTYNAEFTLNSDSVSSFTPSENNFMSSSTETYQSRYYELNVTGDTFWNPILYMRMYTPKPISSFCSSSTDYYSCRTYTSFINRKFFIIAQRKGWTNTLRFSGNAPMAPSDDTNNNYNTRYIAWCHPSQNRYRQHHSMTRSTSLRPSTPSKDITLSIFGSNLHTLSSGFIICVNMNGRTLYRHKTDYGQYRGSYIKVVMSSFTNIFGCGAFFQNKPRNIESPLYCEANSPNQLRIYSKYDIQMNTYLLITLYTSAIPSSSTYRVYLYDKYVDASNNAISVDVSGSFTRTKSGFTIKDSSIIKWRQQTYKQLRSTTGPIRFTFNNNYQYVYDHTTVGNSDGISVNYPGGINSAHKYRCFLNEYPPGKKYLRNEYLIKCNYEDANQIRISSIPSHILSPDYYYQVVIFRDNDGSDGFITISTSDINIISVTSRDSTSTADSSIVMRNQFTVQRYREVYPIALSFIYLLSKQAGAINSIYISYTFNKAGSGFHYFEFQFSNLGLSSFNIQNGEQIPCAMYGAFAEISGSAIKPICKGYAEGISNDGPLVIRVMSINSFSIGSTFKISFDNFNNPGLQQLFLVPIDLKIRYVDRGNNDIYTAEFPSIFVSDSQNRGVPTSISGDFYRVLNARGATNTHSTIITWPYDSRSPDISEKIVMKIQGGITCCQNYDNFILDDTRSSGYITELWTNTIANITVYRTPSLSVASTNLTIRNVVNPYPYQKETYEQTKIIEILFYDNYKNTYIKKINQFDYTSYSQLSEISVDRDFSLVSSTRSYDYHQNYPMTYDIQYQFTRSSFANRQLKETILEFTAGVQSIEKTEIRYTAGSQIVNPLLYVNIFKNTNSRWCLRISGMNQNVYSTAYDWIIRMRFYPNGNSLSYNSKTYAANGELEFSNSDSESLSGDNYNGSAIAPTTFELYEQRYVKGFYELKRQHLYAKTGVETNRLAFRFTTPYEIDQNEQFHINLQSASDLIPKLTNGDLTCIIQKTRQSKTILGTGIFTECAYSTTDERYIIQTPIGGLAVDTQYTISILQQNQLTSAFLMPAVPVNYEVSFIYHNSLSLKFGDVYQLDFMGQMKKFEVNHRIRRRTLRNIIGYTFKPQFGLPAAILTGSITESVIQIEFESRYFDDCLGLSSVYSEDGMVFQSGAYFSHYSNPAVTDANTRILCGQYSESYSPIKLRVTDYGTLNANTQYYFRFPLILNPSSTNMPFVYKIKILSYENSKYYPKVLGYYEYNNLEDTDGYSSSSQYIRLYEDSNDYVQRSMGLSITYNSYYPPINSEIIVKFRNNEIKALTSLSGLTSLTNSNYGHYEYYPNINLCLFKKTTNTNDKSISLGSFPTSTAQESYRISYVHAYHSTGSTHYTSNFNINSQDGTSGSGGSVSATLNVANSWSTSSFTRISGHSRTHSVGIYKISFRSNSLNFPEGSHMTIALDSDFEIEQDECKQLSGFLPGTTLTTSNLICRKQSSTMLKIAGYAHISSSTDLSVTLYLKIVRNSAGSRSPNADIIVYSSDNKKIIDAGTSAISLSLSYGPYDLSLIHEPTQQLRKGIAFEFDFSFELSTHTLTAGHYIVVNFGNWTIDPASTNGQLIWKYKVGNNIYWVPTEVTNPSDNIYKIPVFKNYFMTQDQTIVIRVRQVLPDSKYGIEFPEDQWSYLTIEAFDSSDTRLEHQYRRIWIEPYQHTSLEVTPILKYVEAVTMYEFTFTPNISATAGDILSIEFTTADGLMDNLFPEDLGKTIEQKQSAVVSCHESDHQNIISDDMIKCELFKGDKSSTYHEPAVIQIPITKNIAANTEIKLTVLNLKNPAKDNYPIGITAKLMNLCVAEDINNPCTYYKSTKYIEFDSTPADIPDKKVNGSLTFSQNLVSLTNTQHTFTAPFDINVGDFLKIQYYPEVPIPETCSITSGNGMCYSYPYERTILIKATSAQVSPYSFTLGGMDNLYHTKNVSINPYTEIWDAALGTIRARYDTETFETDYITSDPTTGNPLQITFTPTLTPDYHLKYGFSNIAKVEISHIFQNKHIEMIYLQVSSEISLVDTYCNATLQSTAAEAKPYPIRFECTQMNSSSLWLRKSNNFPEWTSAFTNKKVILYLKYTISNSCSGSSNDWLVRAYTKNDVDDDYEVARATGNFVISELKSPHIYKINFPTQAFSKRTCRVNQICMFYGYLLPSTASNSPLRVSYMTYTLPEQFGYSNQVSYKCMLEEKNDDDNPVTCQASRADSDVIIRFTPSSYNYNYKLVTIDSNDQSKLFTAPQYPGTHYQMKVQLYANTNDLMQSMRVNLTTVYGQLLDYSQIQILVPQDADAIGLFQFKFRVGNQDILPGYENNADNRITSAIQFEFSKSFKDDLGTGKFAGDEVACLAISGISVSSLGKLTCKIYPSVSTITYPHIIVTGYDRISNNSDVVIRISGLQTLPEAIQDYIKIGVSLTYYDYGGVKGYVYEPTGFVVGGATPAVTPKDITFTVTESSTNFVGDLVNYDFSGTIASGAGTVTTNDYIAIEFEEYIFEGIFSQNLKAECTLATSLKCDSYGLSRMIYFKPAADITTSSLVFSINKMINSAFSFEYVNVTFKVFTLISQKVDALGQATLLKFSKPSPNITALVTTIDSIYGGDSEINYYIEFQLKHNLPRYGMVMIEIPKIYESLFDLHSQCILSEDFSSQAYCQITNDYLIVIRPNGTLLLPSFIYEITITNMTNPNMKLQNYQFIITSSDNDDVYDPKIISLKNFESPEISIVEVKTCDTFEVSLSAYNAFTEVLFEISLICESFIKEGSEIKFYLDWAPQQKQDKCSSLTDSLYSYDCAIKNEFRGTSKLTYLNMYLQSSPPQELIVLKSKIKNGKMGIYTLTAQVSYKGFTYLSTKSNQFFIKSDTVKQIEGRDIQIKNYPINRNFDAFYTVKIPSPDPSATDLQIEIPKDVQLAQNEEFLCFILGQRTKQSYLDLVLYHSDETQVSCSFSNSVISINNIGSIIKDLSTDDFLRISFSKFKNIDKSTISQTYYVSFINSETGKGSVVSSGSVQIPVRISDPPNNLQIDQILVSSSKFFVKAIYTIQMSTMGTTAISINSRSQIGVIFSLPEEYLNTISKIKDNGLLNITFGGDKYSSEFHISGLNIIAKYMLDKTVSFDKSTLQFEFLNPGKALDCQALPVYKLSIINLNLNSIVAETLTNNVECPVFNDRLYLINITGKGIVEQGTVEEYVISIQKPAKFLNITPVLTTSAITVQPPFIIFRGYRETVKKFKLKISNALSGTFQMSYLKTEGDQIFYNDIHPENLTVMLSDKQYQVTFNEVDVKSIGLPIQLQVLLEAENSRQFTLVYSHNCSEQYTFDPPSFINIASGTEKTKIMVVYSGKTIPKMCKMQFKISSLTSSRYYLRASELYLSASRSIENKNNYGTMRLKISPEMSISSDVGLIVLDSSSADNVKPTFYKLQETRVGSNSAEFICSVSEKGTIYYAVMKIGTNRNKVLKEQIYNQNVSTGIVYGSSKTFITTQISTIQSNLKVQGLQSQTTYLIGAYLNSSIGNSEITFEVFHTEKSANGAAIKVSFSEIYEQSKILQVFSKVLRVQVQRLALLNTIEILNDAKSSHIADKMNERQYQYEIVLGPNIHDDSSAPLETLREFIDEEAIQNDLIEFLPAFITSYPMSTRQILLNKPKFRGDGIEIIHLNHELVKIKVSTWEEANVTAVVVPAPSTDLLAIQISQGYDQDGQQIDSSHYQSGFTNAEGQIQLQFTLLISNKEYIIFVSAECIVPYPGTQRIDDSQVLKKEVKTKVSLSSKGDEQIIVEALQQKYPEMAVSVAEHIKNVKNKASIAPEKENAVYKGGKKRRRIKKKISF